MSSAELKAKVLLLGDGRVGKTSLAVRYTHNSFSHDYKPSLGVDWLARREEINGKKVKVLIFDAAGQALFQSLRKRYYVGAHGAFVVFDVTRKPTFENLEFWINEIRSLEHEIYLHIVGNKSDLRDMREVSYEEGKAFADSLEADYTETSAKSGENVTPLFSNFVEYVLSMY